MINRAAPAAGRPAVALVTGASSGIGEALALCFARHGFRLVLVARSAERLELLAARLRAEFGARTWVRPVDLGRRGAAHELRADLKRRRIAVDVLVNNAGVLEAGAFSSLAPDARDAMIDLNVAGLTAMVSSFLPPMLARGHGRILNVASIAAFQPVPSLAVYAATKAYVLSLTESLAEELTGTGVTVTALCPGITATGMLRDAVSKQPRLARLPHVLVGDAEQVAAEGYRACIEGDLIAVPGVVNQAAVVAGRATPKWLLRRITSRIVRKAM